MTSANLPIDFLRVPLAAVIGYYAYGEAMDLWVSLGGGIIPVSNCRAVIVETNPFCVVQV